MKKKIKKIILFIILVLVAIALVKYLYTFSIYHKLLKARDKVYQSGNYTCYYYNRGESLDVDTGEWSSSYSKMCEKVKDGKMVDYGYNYDDHDTIVYATYVDENNSKEIFNIDYTTNRFTIGPNLIPIEFRIGFTNYPIYELTEYSLSSLTLKTKLYYLFEDYFVRMFTTNFKTVTEDGKDYIVMYHKDVNEGVYFNKETLLAEKSVSTAMRTDELVVNSYWEIEVGNVTDEDVNLPDLSNFRQTVY